MSDWKPIESAPKDGTEIDIWVVNEDGEGWREPAAYYVTDRDYSRSLYTPDGKHTTLHEKRDGWWAPNHDYDGMHGWCDQPEWFNEHPNQKKWHFIKATHWMPLPEPPK